MSIFNGGEIMEDNQINIYRTDIMRYLIENGMKPDVAGNLVFQCITTQGDLLVLSSVLTSGTGSQYTR